PLASSRGQLGTRFLHRSKVHFSLSRFGVGPPLARAFPYTPFRLAWGRRPARGAGSVLPDGRCGHDCPANVRLLARRDAVPESRLFDVLAVVLAHLDAGATVLFIRRARPPPCEFERRRAGAVLARVLAACPAVHRLLLWWDCQA